MDSKKHSNCNDQGLLEEKALAITEPSLYVVYLINDDYTPMDFVIEVLVKFFYLSYDAASVIMLQIHEKGKGICGKYTKDVAVTKMMFVNDYAKEHLHPLKCDLESA